MPVCPDSEDGHDCVLMNPPFSKGQDVAHILHALKFLKPGGRLVALCANGPRQQAELRPLAATWEALPDGIFGDQGTNVRAALMTMTRKR
jgi:16S rRNA G1207 methylase RsmC